MFLWDFRLEIRKTRELSRVTSIIKMQGLDWGNTAAPPHYCRALRWRSFPKEFPTQPSLVIADWEVGNAGHIVSLRSYASAAKRYGLMQLNCTISIFPSPQD